MQGAKSLVPFAIGLFLGSVAVSALLTAFVRGRAVGANMVARPTAERYHRNVIPLGGGIAIFGTLMLFILGGAGAMKLLLIPGRLAWISERANIEPSNFADKLSQLAVLLGSASVLFALGLWDDVKHLGPKFKLVVQFAAAFGAALFGEIRVEFFIEKTMFKICSTINTSAFYIYVNHFLFPPNYYIKIS